jgi:zinc transport system substrate-binding protein
LKYLKRFIMISFLVVLSACGAESDQGETGNPDALKVYTTVYPLTDFTEKIGGEYVTAESIYPPGADEHTFEPSQKDMMELSDADLFIYIGLGLEGFVDRAKDVLESESVIMVAAGSELESGQEETTSHDDEQHDEHADEESHDEHGEHADEEDEGHEETSDGHGHDHDIDPHVWLDPVYAKELAHSIYENLSEQMPEQEAVFKKNYETLLTQLDELNESFKSTVESAERNQIFVAHAAYSYWEDRYGIEQVAIAGISSTDEPSQQELKNIIDTAKENNISYIIFEQNGSSRLTEVVQKEIGAEKLTLHNLGVRTQEDIDEEKDYFDLMNDNIETLQKALGSE